MTKLQQKPQAVPQGGMIQMLPTRDPSRLAFRVSEPAQTFSPLDMPQQGDRYGSTRLSTKFRSNQQGGDSTQLRDYTYQYCDSDGTNLWFYFTFPYSSVIDDETGLPLNEVPYNTFETNKRWSWPMVLHRLVFVPDQVPIVTISPNPDDSKGYSQTIIKSLSPRKVITAPTNALCLCVVEQFASDTPFPVSEHAQPVEGDIEWSLPGTSGQLRCLHPRTTIPSGTQPYSVIVNATPTSFGNIGADRVYPPTNFEDWAPFVISDEVVRENGVYFRERVTIYPPAANERVSN